MRLDKFLAETTRSSRKAVKQFIKNKQVRVNQTRATNGKQQIDPTQDQIYFLDERLIYQKYYYYMLHKPQGVISATEDRREKTVLDLLDAADYRDDLFPVGRLDKDTEGLLLLTNHGDLAHRLLAPKKHVDKEYIAQIKGVVTQEDVAQFAEGFALKDGVRVAPSQLTITQVDDAAKLSWIRLVIQEGKFHQVKRMLEAVGKSVVYLKRIRMATLHLDADLPLGSYRPLTVEETEALVQTKRKVN